MRWLLLLAVVFVGLACDEETGLELGEPCNAHEECASRLCSIPLPDGGLTDAGPPPPKRCMEPGL